MSHASDSDAKQKRRRPKPSSSPLSLNDNLHATFLSSAVMTNRYTTVDKEKDDEAKSKKTKLSDDRDSDGSILRIDLRLDGYKTWKRPEERFIS